MVEGKLFRGPENEYLPIQSSTKSLRNAQQVTLTAQSILSLPPVMSTEDLAASLEVVLK